MGWFSDLLDSPEGDKGIVTKAADTGHDASSRPGDGKCQRFIVTAAGCQCSAGRDVPVGNS